MFLDFLMYLSIFPVFILQAFFLYWSLLIFKVYDQDRLKFIISLLVIYFITLVLFYFKTLLADYVGTFLGIVILFSVFYFIFENYYQLSFKKVVAVFLFYHLYILVLIGMMVPMSIFLVAPVQIFENSMFPIIKNNEFILVKKFPNRYERGDIVFLHPQVDSDINYMSVKRIVGMPGDKVSIEQGNVFINGSRLDENYLKENVQTVFKGNKKEWQLAKDEYFVLGDNRENSNDSRNYGAVTRENLVGEFLFSMGNLW